MHLNSESDEFILVLNLLSLSGLKKLAFSQKTASNGAFCEEILSKKGPALFQMSECRTGACPSEVNAF